METKVNYAIVGFFVLVFSMALIAVVIWLGAGAEYRKTYDEYLVYMDESVAGLNPNAPVRFKGVSIGRVKDIGLAPDRRESVRLLLQIEKGIPIREDTVATLRSQGLTGIATIELSGGNPDSPILRPKAGERYPVIRSAPSLISRLDTSITPLLANINKSVESLNDTLNAKNRADFSKILANVAQLSDTLAKRSQEIDSSVANASKMLASGEKAAGSLPQLIARMDKAADELDSMAKDAGKTSQAARRTITHVDDAVPEFNALIAELRGLSASLGRVSSEIERNPALLVYGRRPPPPGPGE
ncbi:MAG TPA: MlaD family protein [Burkholderiales bacterium]|nr:MlaD family protein [Burkholderiales bacterium]